MKERLLTAAIGIPFCIFTLAVRGIFAEGVILLITLIALYEVYQALKAANYRAFPYGAFLAAVAVWPMKLLFGLNDPWLLILTAFGITLSGVLLDKEPTFPNMAVSVYPVFTCLMPLLMLFSLLNAQFGSIPGIELVVMIIIVSFLSDAAAYFGGRALGKHKLCPLVSPKKTVEGAVAGVIGGVLGALLTRTVFICFFKSAAPGLLTTSVLGLIGSVAGIVGDLTASLLKRYSGIKDYGHLFPGHGGIMDRFDSILTITVVVYCYTLFL